MIVGTAGHIDHGKTTLVRALTGVDTDRLKEEKERGISIELGYAYAPLENGEVLGFVDVPGHERLVHTMVAGASGIDFALLVVAADDGVMPQTREHLEILELLGVSHGAVALTKVDRADAAQCAAAEESIAAALAPTRLHGAPIFPVVAMQADDDRMLALRAHLYRVARQLPARRSNGLFRLAVDRVFSLPGYGTIATGTVHAGTVHVGDEVAIMPAGIHARVRGIHAQNRESEVGTAGQRCAINLAGIDKNRIVRGDWLADPRALAPTTRIDVRMHRLGSRVKLGDWTPVHVHLGTLHMPAHVVPLDTAEGTGNHAQLVFDVPLCAASGDRFILRDAQAAHTIGGGVVLDPHAPARKRRSSERLQFLAAIEARIAGAGLGALLEQAPFGLRITELLRLTGLPPEHIVLPAGTHLIQAVTEKFALTPARWQELRKHALAALRSFHEKSPDETGVDAARLRRIALPSAPEELWRALIDELLAEKLVSRSGPWLHSPEHAVTLSKEETELAERLRPLICAGHFDPPWVRDLAHAVAVTEQAVRRTLRKLATQGVVYQVVPDLFYDRGRLLELAALASELAREHGAIEAAALRDRSGLGRKRTIQILEFFDRVGYTRRVRDTHRPRSDSDAGAFF